MKFSGHSETKPVREAVGIVVRKTDDRGQVLQVRRPLDDPDLPNLWGLPAGKRQPGEKWLEAVKRAGREKLGVQLEVTALLGQGNMEREGYELFMRLYEASIKDAQPHVPQPIAHITQYSSWAWGPLARLQEAAHRGSLCCRLLLESLRPK